MAAGTSSPELFAALTSIFLDPHNDSGPGTILGSVVFNIGMIIGLSIWLAGTNLFLCNVCLGDRVSVMLLMSEGTSGGNTQVALVFFCALEILFGTD